MCALSASPAPRLAAAGAAAPRQPRSSRVVAAAVTATRPIPFRCRRHMLLFAFDSNADDNAPSSSPLLLLLPPILPILLLSARMTSSTAAATRPRSSPRRSGPCCCAGSPCRCVVLLEKPSVKFVSMAAIPSDDCNLDLFCFLISSTPENKNKTTTTVTRSAPSSPRAASSRPLSPSTAAESPPRRPNRPSPSPASPREGPCSRRTRSSCCPPGWG